MPSVALPRLPVMLPGWRKHRGDDPAVQLRENVDKPANFVAAVLICPVILDCGHRD